MPANLEVATGGIVPPALQGHTPDIVAAVRPGSRPPAPEARRSVRRARDRRAGRLDSRCSTRSLARGARFSASRSPCRTWTAESVDEVAPLGRPLELAADRGPRLAPWLSGSRVLPAAHPALAREGQRGAVRVPAVRRAHRLGPPRGDRRRAPRAVPSGRPARGRRGGSRDPARLRPQHGVRQTRRRGLVGVREVVGVVRGPRRQLALRAPRLNRGRYFRPAHSSSGLGHRPLTAAARVRIPYAPFSVAGQAVLAWLRESFVTPVPKMLAAVLPRCCLGVLSN